MNEADRTLLPRLALGQHIEAAQVLSFFCRRKTGFLALSSEDAQKVNRGLPLPRNYSKAAVAMLQPQSVASFLAESNNNGLYHGPTAFYLANENPDARSKVDFGTLFVVGSVMPLSQAWKLIYRILPLEQGRSSLKRLTDDLAVRRERYVMPAKDYMKNIPVIWTASEVTDPTKAIASTQFILPPDNTMVVNERGAVYYIYEGMNTERQNPKHAFFVREDDSDPSHMTTGIIPKMDRVVGWPEPFANGVCGFTHHRLAIANKPGQMAQPLMALRCCS